MPALSETFLLRLCATLRILPTTEVILFFFRSDQHGLFVFLASMPKPGICLRSLPNSSLIHGLSAYLDQTAPTHKSCNVV